METVSDRLTRAHALAQEGKIDDATAVCMAELDEDSQCASALALLGWIDTLQSKHQTAFDHLTRAIVIKADIPAWHAHLASVARALCRMDVAKVHGEEAFRLAPDDPDSLVNLALTYVDLDRHDDATSCLIRAIGLKHDHADAHLALGQILLSRGEFDAGWREYEWRHETAPGKMTLPSFTSMHWNGMRIPNGRLVLVGDQGYGDTIQFSRYIGMAAECVQEVVLGCSAELAPLFRGVAGVSSIVHAWDHVPGHAAHCRLSTLPYLFNTTLKTIPAPLRVSRPERGPYHKLRVGFSWTGRPTHPNNSRRSIGLAAMEDLIRNPGIEAVSLQKGAVSPDMVDHSDALGDFGDTADLVAGVDLVITIDTSVAHLAASMGKPTWIMLAKAADWRWMLERSVSPWYPSVRLFRQKAPGDWNGVISEVSAAMDEYLWLRKMAA